jgi:hypothetical protein
MKNTLLGLGLLATGLSSLAGATVFNGAASSVTLDLADASFTSLTGSLASSDFQFTAPSATSFSESFGATPGSVDDVNNSAGVNASSLSTYARGSASTAGNELSVSAQATDGQSSEGAAEIFSFTLTGAGQTLLQVPYALLSSATSSNPALSFGNSSNSVSGSGTVNSAHSLFSLDWNALSAQTSGGVTVSNDADALDFLLSNAGPASSYAFNFSTTAQAWYSGDPAPVPEVPAPMMLALGFIPLLSRRSRKFLGL